jgi:hypothetical protein
MFKQLMDSMLWGTIYEACLVYQDKMTVVSWNFQVQPDNPYIVSHLKLNPKKW